MAMVDASENMPARREGPDKKLIVLRGGPWSTDAKLQAVSRRFEAKAAKTAFMPTARILNEAIRCHMCVCNMAAVLLSRDALEEMICALKAMRGDDYGGRESLKGLVKWARRHDWFDSYQETAADSIRVAGNSIAHVGEDINVTIKEIDAQLPESSRPIRLREHMVKLQVNPRTTHAILDAMTMLFLQIVDQWRSSNTA